jgi:hypothetical protein
VQLRSVTPESMARASRVPYRDLSAGHASIFEHVNELVRRLALTCENLVVDTNRPVAGGSSAALGCLVPGFDEEFATPDALVVSERSHRSQGSARSPEPSCGGCDPVSDRCQVPQTFTLCSPARDRSAPLRDRPRAGRSPRNDPGPREPDPTAAR